MQDPRPIPSLPPPDAPAPVNYDEAAVPPNYVRYRLDCWDARNDVPPTIRDFSLYQGSGSVSAGRPCRHDGERGET